MKIYIANKKIDFTKDQIVQLEKIGTVAFLETSPFKPENIPQNSEEKLLMIDPDYVDWNFTNEMIDKISNLKAIFVPSTSFSWFDLTYLKKKKIALINVPKYSTESVAEYAISLMFSVAKKLPLIIKNNWKLNYSEHLGEEVKGKTMGIIGLGAIGKRIGELGLGMGMKVIYWSKNSRDTRFKYLELDEVLKKTDFIFPTLAKNSETKNFINNEKIDLIKDGAYIISITGDDIFDFKYACAKVKKGKLAGIAIELGDKIVNDFEGNVWVTPPIAWYTKEAVKEDFRIWVENVVKYSQSQIQNRVD